MKFVILVLFLCTLPGLHGEQIVFKDGSVLEGALTRKEGTPLTLEVSRLSVSIFKTHVLEISQAGKFPKLSEKEEEKLRKNIADLYNNKGRKSTEIFEEFDKMGIAILPYLEPFLAEKETFFTTERILDLLESWDSDLAIPTLVRCLEKENDNALNLRTLRLLEKRRNQASLYVLSALLLKGIYGLPITRIFERWAKRKELPVSAVLLGHLKHIKAWEERHANFIIALGMLRYKEVFALFEEVLRNREKYSKPIQLTCIRSLQHTQSEDAVTNLSLFLGDFDFDVAREIICALGRNGRSSAIPALLGIVKNEENVSQSEIKFIEAAYWSLEQLSGRKFPRTHQAWSDWWEEYQTTRTLLNEIYREMESGDEKTVLRALEKLGSLSNKEVVNQVSQLLRHDSVKVRRMACSTLAKSGAYFFDILEEIVELLKDPPVSAQAHYTLSKMTRWSLPPDFLLWSTWIEAYRHESPEQLVKMISHPSAEMKQMAMVELRKRKEASAIAPTLRLLGNMDFSKPTAKDIQLASSAMLLLRTLSSKDALPLLVSILESQNPQIKSASYNALRGITGKKLSMDAKEIGRASCRERV